MKFKEIISGLDKLGRSGSVYRRTVCRLAVETMEVMQDKLRETSSLLKSQQGRIAELEAELKEERYRHDRLQDFEVAEAQELAKLREERRWIPVGERLPENDYGKHWKERKHYLVRLAPSGLMCVAHYGYKEYGWWIDGHDCVLSATNFKEVTHWMPLPEPPKEDS